MANISVTYAFSNSTTADGTQVNQNFTDIINGTSDGTKSFNISALTCGSTATFNSAVILGASSANSLTFNGSVASSIPVSANTSWDFGSATLGLKSIYIGGSSTFTIRILGATQSASYTLTLPAAVPTANSALIMDTGGTVTLTNAATGMCLSVGNGTYPTWNISSGDICLGNQSNGRLIFGTNNTLVGGFYATGGFFIGSSANNTLYYNGTTGSLVLKDGVGLGVQAGAQAPVFQAFAHNSIAIQDDTGSTGSGHVKPIVVSYPPSANGLMIIRGTVNANYSLATGEGISSIVSATTGMYSIRYAQAFQDVPAFFATVNDNGSGYLATAGSNATTSCIVRITVAGAGVVEEPFSFMAIGQRATNT